MTLPWAEQVEELRRGLVVAVTAKGEVALEGVVVEGDDQDMIHGWIDPLTEQLEIYRNNWLVTHPGQPFAAKLLVQADVEADSRVIKRVVHSAGRAGYHQLQFVAIKKSPPTWNLPSR